MRKSRLSSRSTTRRRNSHAKLRESFTPEQLELADAVVNDIVHRADALVDYVVSNAYEEAALQMRVHAVLDLITHSDQVQRSVVEYADEHLLDNAVIDGASDKDLFEAARDPSCYVLVPSEKLRKTRPRVVYDDTLMDFVTIEPEEIVLTPLIKIDGHTIGVSPDKPAVPNHFLPDNNLSKFHYRNVIEGESVWLDKLSAFAEKMSSPLWTIGLLSYAAKVLHEDYGNETLIQLAKPAANSAYIYNIVQHAGTSKKASEKNIAFDPIDLRYVYLGLNTVKSAEKRAKFAQRLYTSDHFVLGLDVPTFIDVVAEVRRLKNKNPAKDNIVYKYKGTNDQISGSSSEGMYVAELRPDQIRAEGREQGLCLGGMAEMFVRRMIEGATKFYSIRTKAGKIKFTIQIDTGPSEYDFDPLSDDGGGYPNNLRINEVRGSANAFPGYDAWPKNANAANDADDDADDADVDDHLSKPYGPFKKPDAVRLVVEFLVNYLKCTREQVARQSEMTPGIEAMLESGVDPFEPPVVKRRSAAPRSNKSRARVRRNSDAYSTGENGVVLTLQGNIGAKSAKITEIGQYATAVLRDYAPNVAERLIQNKRHRDKGDVFHVTIVSPPEVRAIVADMMSRDPSLTKSRATAELKSSIESITISDVNLTALGLGKAEQDGDVAYFGVVEWPEALQLRHALQLDIMHDFHITVGFNEKDVHGVRKDVRTRIARNNRK